MKAHREISQRFANQWLSFVSDQSGSFMSLREACSPAEKAEPATGENDFAQG
jgi:hypothetical protein